MNIENYRNLVVKEKFTYFTHLFDAMKKIVFIFRRLSNNGSRVIVQLTLHELTWPLSWSPIQSPEPSSSDPECRA